jgi:hypothetical protein
MQDERDDDKTVSPSDVLRVQDEFGRTVRAPNKMNLHSSGLFWIWTASDCIDHPQMACFAFLARSQNAHSRCHAHFVSDSRSKQLKFCSERSNRRVL